MILTLVQAFGKDVHREHAGGWTRVFVMMALLFLVNFPPPCLIRQELTADHGRLLPFQPVSELDRIRVRVRSWRSGRDSRHREFRIAFEDPRSQMLTPILTLATDVRPLGHL